jgi:hypothetical protein
MCLTNSRTIDTIIINLVKAKILALDSKTSQRKLFAHISQGFEKYCKAVDISIPWASAIADIHQEFYDMAAHRFEALEHLGLISGNGHHMATDLVDLIDKDLHQRWRN